MRLALLAWSLSAMRAAEGRGSASGDAPAELQVAVERLGDAQRAQSALFPARDALPSLRELSHPGAQLMAVNFGRLSLLPGDELTVRGRRGSDAVTVTAANQSAAMDATAYTHVWDYPFVVAGDAVTIEYRPSLPTLILPQEAARRHGPVAVVDSYVYALPLGGGVAATDASSDAAPVEAESIVGNQSELHEAVCFKQCAPQMYAKADAVARLLIRKYDEDPPRRWGRRGEEARPSTNSWAFCTGWVLGRGNYLVTNYHCVDDALQKYGGVYSSWGSTARASDSGGASKEEATADVNFRAETETCADRGYKGEKSGVVEATRVSVVATNKSLDYALLVVKRSRSGDDLSSTYGYLTIRASGPVDGEPIYIPQHPNGEPKEIAAVSDGKLATVHVLEANTTSWASPGSASDLQGAVGSSVWYDADTRPGSSGSPVISQRDNTVVALHHAGGASWGLGGRSSVDQRNYGVRMDAIARDMEARGVLPLCAVARTCRTSSTGACCSSQRRP